MPAAAAPDLTSTDSPTRAVIYARVSRDTAGGRSVEEQQAECRAECERQGWAVADVLVDNDISASRHSTKDRPEYARLRAILRPGDMLVTWEASRAQRDLARYVELRDLCAERGVFWSYSGRLFDLRDGDDRFATGLDALLAEKEAEQTRSRILRAHRANLAAGKPHGRAVSVAQLTGDGTATDVDQVGQRILDHRQRPGVGVAAVGGGRARSARAMSTWTSAQRNIGRDEPTLAGLPTPRR